MTVIEGKYDCCDVIDKKTGFNIFANGSREMKEKRTKNFISCGMSRVTVTPSHLHQSQLTPDNSGIIWNSICIC